MSQPLTCKAIPCERPATHALLFRALHAGEMRQLYGPRCAECACERCVPLDEIKITGFWTYEGPSPEEIEKRIGAAP